MTCVQDRTGPPRTAHDYAVSVLFFGQLLCGDSRAVWQGIAMWRNGKCPEWIQPLVLLQLWRISTSLAFPLSTVKLARLFSSCKGFRIKNLASACRQNGSGRIPFCTFSSAQDPNLSQKRPCLHAHWSILVAFFLFGMFKNSGQDPPDSYGVDHCCHPRRCLALSLPRFSLFLSALQHSAKRHRAKSTPILSKILKLAPSISALFGCRL